MKPNNDSAIRKRSQISKSNRNMFLWIAGASVLVGFALVATIFLGQKLIFNEKILTEKNKTIATLSNNNQMVPGLETAIRVLDTNQDLAKNKANENDQTVQVILDSLPADANSLALGASLQNKLLAGISGLTIESLQVDPVQGVESTSDSAIQDGGLGVASTGNEIIFRFTISGNQEALKQALLNLERSIRTIDITSLQIENQGGSQVMTVQGRAFYEPAREVKLYDKVVRP